MIEGIEPFLGGWIDAEVGEEEEAGEVVGGVSSEAAVVEVDSAGGVADGSGSGVSLLSMEMASVVDGDGFSEGLEPSSVARDL